VGFALAGFFLWIYALITPWREFAAIAAALVFAVTSGALWFRVSNLQRQLEAAKRDEAALRQSESDTRKGAGELQSQLADEQKQSQALEEKINELEKFSTMDPSSRVVYAVQLGIDYLIGDSKGSGPSKVKFVVIPAKTSLIRLAVDFPKSDFQTFKVNLRRDRSTVWTRGGLKARGGRDNQTINLAIPADRIANGDYDLVVSGVNTNGDTESVAQSKNELIETARRQGIQPCGRFIQKEDAWVQRERTRQRGTLAHPAGELRRHHLLRLLETDHREHLRHPRRNRFLVEHPMLAERKRDVVADGERVEERALLEEHAHATSHWNERILVEGLEPRTLDLDAAIVGSEEAVQVLQEHALAATATAHQDERLAFGHLEIHAAQHRLRTERLLHALTANDGRRHVLRKSLVRKKSAIRMAIEIATTVFVVLRPTPAVPPRVIMPK